MSMLEDILYFYVDVEGRTALKVKNTIVINCIDLKQLMIAINYIHHICTFSVRLKRKVLSRLQNKSED